MLFQYFRRRKEKKETDTNGCFKIQAVQIHERCLTISIITILRHNPAAYWASA